MPPSLSRRSFLKFSAAASLGLLVSRVAQEHLLATEKPSAPNVIVLLYDTLSARHLSLYGYPRATSPNMERFAARAYVYHQHHVAGNFTTPSTASLFTGVYPWTHRALALEGTITRSRVPFNLFRFLPPHYHRAALCPGWAYAVR